MTEPKTEELKACPFCGANATLQTDVGKYWGVPFVGCANCGTRTNCGLTEDEAIKAWNRRTPTKDEGERKGRYKRCPTCESHYSDCGPHTEEKGCWICEPPKFKGYKLIAPVYHWTKRVNVAKILEHGLPEGSWVCRRPSDWHGEACLIVGGIYCDWGKRTDHLSWQATTHKHIPGNDIKEKPTAPVDKTPTCYCVDCPSYMQDCLHRRAPTKDEGEKICLACERGEDGCNQYDKSRTGTCRYHRLPTAPGGKHEEDIADAR